MDALTIRQILVLGQSLPTKQEPPEVPTERPRKQTRYRVVRTKVGSKPCPGCGKTISANATSCLACLNGLRTEYQTK